MSKFFGSWGKIGTPALTPFIPPPVLVKKLDEEAIELFGGLSPVQPVAAASGTIHVGEKSKLAPLFVPKGRTTFTTESRKLGSVPLDVAMPHLSTLSPIAKKPEMIVGYEKVTKQFDRNTFSQISYENVPDSEKATDYTATTKFDFTGGGEKRSFGKFMGESTTVPVTSRDIYKTPKGVYYFVTRYTDNSYEVRNEAGGLISGGSSGAYTGMGGEAGILTALGKTHYESPKWYGDGGISGAYATQRAVLGVDKIVDRIEGKTMFTNIISGLATKYSPIASTVSDTITPLGGMRFSTADVGNKIIGAAVAMPHLSTWSPIAKKPEMIVGYEKVTKQFDRNTFSQISYENVPDSEKATDYTATTKFDFTGGGEKRSFGKFMGESTTVPVTSRDIYKTPKGVYYFITRYTDNSYEVRNEAGGLISGGSSGAYTGMGGEAGILTALGKTHYESPKWYGDGGISGAYATQRAVLGVDKIVDRIEGKTMFTNIISGLATKYSPIASTVSDTITPLGGMRFSTADVGNKIIGAAVAMPHLSTWSPIAKKPEMIVGYEKVPKQFDENTFSQISYENVPDNEKATDYTATTKFDFTGGGEKRSFGKFMGESTTVPVTSRDIYKTPKGVYYFVTRYTDNSYEVRNEAGELISGGSSGAYTGMGGEAGILTALGKTHYESPKWYGDGGISGAYATQRAVLGVDKIVDRIEGRVTKPSILNNIENVLMPMGTPIVSNYGIEAHGLRNIIPTLTKDEPHLGKPEVYTTGIEDKVIDVSKTKTPSNNIYTTMLSIIPSLVATQVGKTFSPITTSIMKGATGGYITERLTSEQLNELKTSRDY